MRSIYIRCLSALSVFAIGCSPAVVTPDALLFTGDSGGCGNFHVYRFNTNRTIAISLYVDQKALAIGEGHSNVEIDQNQNGLQLEIVQFAQPAGSYFCDDVDGDPFPIATWVAVTGEIEIGIAYIAPPAAFANATHRVAVVMKNIKVKNSKTGQLAELSDVRIEDVWVGWLPG